VLEREVIKAGEPFLTAGTGTAVLRGNLARTAP